MDTLGWIPIAALPPPPGGPFNLVGFGDINRDLKADLIWERGSHNAVFLEFQDSNAQVGSGFIANCRFLIDTAFCWRGHERP